MKWLLLCTIQILAGELVANAHQVEVVLIVGDDYIHVVRVAMATDEVPV